MNATARLAACMLMGTSLIPSMALAQSSSVGASDGDGPNDEQEQSDLTAIEISCSANSITDLPLSVQLDPVSNPGGNSSDISILFDTDDDGFANYSYVITLQGDPFTVGAIDLQRGKNDTSPTKITGPRTSLGIGTSSSGTSIAINPFDGGDDTSIDLNLDLSAIAADAGVSITDVEFLNVTTIPSSSAASNPKDTLLAIGQAFTSSDNDATDVDVAVNVDAYANDSSRIDWSTAIITSPPSHGTATINVGGTITYIPDGDYTGIDTFTYAATGTDCSSYTSTVTINITGLAANNDSATVTYQNFDIPAVLNVHDNDSLDGSQTTPSTTTLSVASSSSLPAELSFDTATGDVGITSLGLPGTYSFDYQTCSVADPTDCDIATATVTIVAADVDLAITKTNGTAQVQFGTTTTYSTTVINNGPDPIAGAVVTDTPGAGITCEATQPVTITGDGVPAGSYTFADLLGSGIPLGLLASGQSATLTYSCLVS